MQYFKNIIIALTILLGLITFAQSETSWIKKKDKTETVKKAEKEKTTSWIKKKEVKENKKKLKEKIKESKSWITKKSKEKVKDIKNKLKKHKNIEDLPKAEFYFAAIIEPIEDEEPQYIYGYVNSNQNSKTFNFNDKTFFSKSDGIAYFENKKYRCQIDSKITPLTSALSGDVILDCKNNKKMSGAFVQIGSVGEGIGVHWNGNRIKFQFFSTKKDAIAKIQSYKDTTIMLAHGSPDVGTPKNIKIKPNGKYYALLIGNSNYSDASWASLKSPINDVNEISKILKKKYSFEKIITLNDADRNEMFDAFDELSKISTYNDYVLIYYSGHGDTKQNQAYWIPSNGTKKIRDWINIRDISVYVEDMKAQHLVLMIDSCYTGSALKGKKINNNNNNENLNRFANKLLNSRARYVLSSGGNEPVIDSSGEKHSLFAKSFIRSLNEIGFVSMKDIAYNVAIAHSGLDQRPYFYSPESWDHAGGDFIFIPKNKIK